MPQRALRLCRRVGCPELIRTIDGYCEAHRKAAHKNYNTIGRPKAHSLYGTQRWKMRRLSQLVSVPFCQHCGGIATIAHHVEDWGGDPVKFMTGELESICHGCHNAEHHAQA